VPAGLLAGLDRLVDYKSEVEVDRTGIVARNGMATGMRSIRLRDLARIEVAE
jgi:hypothetical protein